MSIARYSEDGDFYINFMIMISIETTSQFKQTAIHLSRKIIQPRLYNAAEKITVSFVKLLNYAFFRSYSNKSFIL